MTDSQHAAEALRYATEANDINAWASEQRQILAATGQTFATLALADQQAETNRLLRTYLDSVNPPAAQDEQLQQDITDQQIQELAATLWAADPGNLQSPARTFAQDYLHRQDGYLAMARAALGLTDQPTQKDSRRP